MAAVILQQAAGGALSSPGAVDFSCRMVAMAAPRLLRLTQRNYHASSRPAIAGARAMPMAGPAPGSRGFSSYDKFASQLKEEEDKMKTKKELAVALLNDTPSSDLGDHKEEVKSISNLLSLLGASAPAPANGATADQLASQLLNERRSALEKKKNALLIELLNGDGNGREQKMSEVVAAGRQLIDDLTAHEERRSHLAFTAELRTLQQTVQANRLQAERNHKMAMDSAEAVKMEVKSANAYAHSVRADVWRLETGVKEAKSEAKEALKTAESTNEEVKKLQGRVSQCREDLNGTRFLSNLLFWVGLGSGTYWLLT